MITALPGDDVCVPEYWLLDPQLEQAEFYRFDAQGRSQVVAPDDNGIYHAKVVAGFWLRVAWLWRQPLPDPVQGPRRD